MALAQDKKGGPYTKNDREDRRDKVAHLHFEYGYPAKKIAEMLSVNPNTVYADVKLLYENIKEETKQQKEDFVLQQIGRLEAQRARIIQSIMDSTTDKTKSEKLLLEIDAKISDIRMRINSEHSSIEIDETKIREITLFLIIKYAKDPTINEEYMTSEIINTQQCTTETAKQILSQMNSLGLESSKKFKGSAFFYDLLEFALLRKYVTHNSEFIKQIRALGLLHYHALEQIEQLDKRYKEKFGRRESWNDETHSKNSEEKKQVYEKDAKTKTEIISDIIDKLGEGVIDKEVFLKYVDCISVFFGEDKPMMDQMFYE